MQNIPNLRISNAIYACYPIVFDKNDESKGPKVNNKMMKTKLGESYYLILRYTKQLQKSRQLGPTLIEKEQLHESILLNKDS